MDPAAKRLFELVELAKPREYIHTMPQEKCLQLLNEIHQMGNFYASQGQDEERAFVFYLRFISMVVEELPRHPCFSNLSFTDKHSLDARTFNAMSTAEQLKQRIRQRYERERDEKGRAAGVDQIPSTSSTAAHPMGIPSELDQLLVSDHKLSPYVRCQGVSMQPIVFQRIIIPNNIPELFMSQQTVQDGTRFALLYGRLVSNSKSVIIAQITPCSLESISARDFRRFMADPTTGEDLPIVGCICSSLAKTCQAGFFRFCQISEMVCVVCPTGPNRTVVLHLVNMAPSAGVSSAQTTTAGQPPAAMFCVHQHITDSISAYLAQKPAEMEKIPSNGVMDSGAGMGKSPALKMTKTEPKEDTEGNGNSSRGNGTNNNG